ncbi:hypothetical protein NZ698_19080 [Chryseobacterium sp. PBS4-4]|uniref:Uncharacterized protein n=1 Tax=Chryseobacterium edaphi TaxID=2976532 RepID=A0ABT2WBB4_9FLAO|nr:hypothetical protein [Chryseobacterium edaphi]MCU7619289.1 hypothetical protein [Chryseobacterium edaphi]
MDMIEDMQIHISKNIDYLFFAYPDEKKIKISEFVSFSNIRFVDDKKLLDSIYDVSIQRDSLRIKFYFGGKKDKNQYVLMFSPTNKEVFYQKSQKLRNDKTRLFGMLKSVDYSGLDLLLPVPSYFNKNINLNVLNPVQFAEMISVDNDGLQVSANHFSFNLKSENNLKYSEYYIQRSDKLNFFAAKIGSQL